METTLMTSATDQREQDLFRAISLTALLTGTLVIASVIVKFYLEYQQGPIPVLRHIASGVFGKETASAGTLMIIWGIVFHYMIAFLFTTVLFIIYPAMIKWLRNKFITAFIYGLFTWAVMNLAVVPLSKINKFPTDPEQAITEALILVVMIGLPVALAAHSAYSRKGSRLDLNLTANSRECTEDRRA